ncbi:MAG: hypothetical protein V4677_14720 [Bacteroidota bacterium]
MYKNCITILFLLFIMSVNNSATAQNSLTKLEGTWYVNMSNFKMWLKGNKLYPKFNYTLQTKRDITGLKDVVSYIKNEKKKTIVGFDKPENTSATKFTWRGKGLLFLFKSKWEILYQTDQYTVIHFEKTLATAEGYDVISRQKSFDEATISTIRTKLKELGITKELTVIKQE